MDYFNQESERLRFRKLTKEDIPNWVAFFINNDRLHLLGMDLSKKKEQLAKEWILKQLTRYKEQGLGHLAVETKDGGEFIGMGGVLPRVLKGKVEYEIAYSLKPQYWKKGYGTEIAKQMKRYGLNNIKTTRLISIIALENYDSLKVAVKNGMNELFQTEYLGMKVAVYGIDNNLIKEL